MALDCSPSIINTSDDCLKSKIVFDKLLFSIYVTSLRSI